MKKTICFIAVIFLGFSLFSQAGADSSNEFYEKVEEWETWNLIEKQPLLRPFTTARIKEILKTVSNCGNKKAAEDAKTLYGKYFEKKVDLKFSNFNSLKNSSLQEKNTFYSWLNYAVTGDLLFKDIIGAGFNVGAVSFYGKKNLAYYEREGFSFSDGFYIGKVYTAPEVDTAFSLEYGGFFVQTGINHISFGPFSGDNINFSHTARHTGNFSLGYSNKKFTYTNLMSILTAEADWNADSLSFRGYVPEKYLFTQSYQFNFKNFFAAFYQSVILGGRFEPAYFIPMLYVVTEGITGYNLDNIFYGVTSGFNIYDFSLKGNFYLDDVGFYDENGGVDFAGTIKLRAALQLGLDWRPKENFLINKISGNYTLVTPYMYTHVSKYSNEKKDFTMLPVNYQIYTTGGTPLGSNLPPNSDRIALKVELAPVSGLSVKVGGAFIRHGNVTESLTKEEQISLLASPAGFYATDGSINQHSAYGENGDTKKDRYMDSADNRTMILTQPTKEYTFQTDIEIGWKLPPSKAGKFEITAGYTFEYIKNYGVGNEMLAGKGWKYNSQDQKYYESYDSSTETYTNEVDVESELAKALADWKSQLKNVMNHYLTVKFKYSY